jgi:hypothetical protein
LLNLRLPGNIFLKLQHWFCLPNGLTATC